LRQRAQLRVFGQLAHRVGVDHPEALEVARLLTLPADGRLSGDDVDDDGNGALRSGILGEHGAVVAAAGAVEPGAVLGDRLHGVGAALVYRAGVAGAHRLHELVHAPLVDGGGGRRDAALDLRGPVDLRRDLHVAVTVGAGTALLGGVRVDGEDHL